MSRGIRFASQSFVLGGLLAFLGACHSAPKVVPAPKPVETKAEVWTAADLNPDPRGRPSPLVVWIFQLRGDGNEFLRAEFDNLTSPGHPPLASESAERQRFMAYPGATTQIPLRIDPQTQSLGVVAEYSDQRNSQWRALSPPPARGWAKLLEQQSLAVQLYGRVVEVHTIPRKRGS